MLKVTPIPLQQNTMKNTDVKSNTDFFATKHYEKHGFLKVCQTIVWH